MIKFLDLEKVTAGHANEINEAVSRVVNSGWYLLGEEVKKFENSYASYIGGRLCHRLRKRTGRLVAHIQGMARIGRTATGR